MMFTFETNILILSDFDKFVRFPKPLIKFPFIWHESKIIGSKNARLEMISYIHFCKRPRKNKKHF